MGISIVVKLKDTRRRAQALPISRPDSRLVRKEVEKGFGLALEFDDLNKSLGPTPAARILRESLSEESRQAIHQSLHNLDASGNPRGYPRQVISTSVAQAMTWSLPLPMQKSALEPNALVLSQSLFKSLLKLAQGRPHFVSADFNGKPSTMFTPRDGTHLLRKGLGR